jgi:hypothetical protein
MRSETELEDFSALRFASSSSSVELMPLSGDRAGAEVPVSSRQAECSAACSADGLIDVRTSIPYRLRRPPSVDARNPYSGQPANPAVWRGGYRRMLDAMIATRWHTGGG